MKKTLLDRVEFDESDLLAYCRHHDIQLEGIVGCRPQVLLLSATHDISRGLNFGEVCLPNIKLEF